MTDFPIITGAHWVESIRRARATPNTVSQQIKARITMSNESPTPADMAVATPVPAERRAPVQGFAAGIPWSMHLRAYDVYCKKFGSQEALIQGGCRGGFGDTELDMFIPGWREELSEIANLRAEVAALKHAPAQGQAALAEALRPFAALADLACITKASDGETFMSSKDFLGVRKAVLTVGDIRRAKAALAADKEARGTGGES